MKVICGEMEFGVFMMGGAPTPMCIIHEVHATLDVDDDFDFDDLLLKYGSYIVPEQSKHEIVYSKQPKE